MALLKILIARLREPSSAAGLASLLLAVGINLPESMMVEIMTAIGALAGVAGMLLKEKGDS